MLALATFLTMTGCTGFRATGTVTPMTFLLPGFLGKYETQPMPNPSTELAETAPLVTAR
jgi:hypothetical protein